MPRPERQKMTRTAGAQKALDFLRKNRKDREKKKSQGSSAENSANVSKDNTSPTVGLHVSSPMKPTSSPATKAFHDNKMPIYKNSTGPASLKRKAEEIDDGFVPRKGDKPEQGHRTKKAKPTCGYVPGTGKPYRGTAREMPTSRPFGSVGALRDKSTNAPLKRRETVAEQDTPKPTAVHSKGMGRPTQEPRKVADTEAVGRVSSNGPQQSKRVAPKAAKLGMAVDVKHGPRQAPKRKNGNDLEHEAKKKPRIGSGSAPVVRELEVDVGQSPPVRTTSSFVQKQRPSHAAVIPTNVRHVQEVVKEPFQESPKTPKKTAESPTVKEGEAKALGEKRQREDDAEYVESKRVKLSTAKPTGRKAASIEGQPKEPLTGLQNHHRACFANAGLQCLFGVPELIAHYEAHGEKTSHEVPNVPTGYREQTRGRKATRRGQKEKKQRRLAVEDKRLIGEHFGALARDYSQGSRGGSIRPDAFLDACGAVFKDEEGRPLNGDTSQDTAQFLNELLKKLHDEELMGRTETADAEKPTLVQELFHTLEGKKLVCKECALTRNLPSQPTADCYGLKVDLPTLEESVTLGELLGEKRTGELLDDHECPNCKRTDTTTLEAVVEKLPKYLIVHTPRARHVLGKNMQLLIRKIHTKIALPVEALDLSSSPKDSECKEAHQYEVFGMVEHVGRSETDGHYVAERKIQGKWYHIDDERIVPINDDKLSTQGTIFFLRRVE